MDFFDALLRIFIFCCQTALLAVPLYYLFIFLRRTRGYRILFGLVTVLVAMYLAARWFRMYEIGWLLGRIATYVPFVMIVIFQPELRRLFSQLGGRPGARGAVSADKAADIVEELTKCVDALSNKRIGAIIAIEQEENLDPFAVGGRELSAPIVGELILSIFYPGTSLHDGGMILRGEKIAWAGCVFPLGAAESRRRGFGTRHRAAIGLSERTDAVVVVVSEETGNISIAHRGEIAIDVNVGALMRILQACIGAESQRSEVGRIFAELAAASKEIVK